MKGIIRFLLIALTLIGHAAPTLAQEVSISDPGLNAAIRAALQKPTGRLTETDLLVFDYLSAVVSNAARVRAHPAQWLPWNFHQALVTEGNTS